MADNAHNPAAPDRHKSTDGSLAHDPERDLEDVERAPGLVVMAGALLAFVVSVATFAVGKVGAGIAAASGGMLILSAGLCWLAMERRRVRDAEREVPFSDPPP